MKDRELEIDGWVHGCAKSGEGGQVEETGRTELVDGCGAWVGGSKGRMGGVGGKQGWAIPSPWMGERHGGDGSRWRIVVVV